MNVILRDWLRDRVNNVYTYKVVSYDDVSYEMQSRLSGSESNVRDNVVKILKNPNHIHYVKMLRALNELKAELVDGGIAISRSHEVVKSTNMNDDNIAAFRVRMGMITDEYPTLLVTHDECNDGLGCELVMSKVSSRIKVFKASHGKTTIDEVIANTNKNTTVVIADYSFSVKDLIKLSKRVRCVYLIDHHKTALDMVLDNEEKLTKAGIYYNVDMALSGTVLLEDVLGITSRGMSIMIQDRDLFNLFIEDTKLLNLMLRYGNVDMNTLKIASRDNSMLDILISEYKGLLDYINTVVKKDSLKYTVIDVNGMLVAATNIKHNISDVLNLISKSTGLPGMSYSIDSGNMVFSIRSYTDKVNVAKVAKEFGGGGHIQAAGFSLKLKDIDLEEFFNNNRLILKESIDDEKDCC